MKMIVIASLILGGILGGVYAQASSQTTTTKLTCGLQWKNTKAAPMQFYLLVNNLGSASATVVSKNPVDDWKQVVFGLKPTPKGFIANQAFFEMAAGDPKTGSPGSDARTSAKNDIVVELDDGISSVIEIRLYKNSKFKTGYIKQHCDPSYCGDFDYYSQLNCALSL